MKTVVIVRDQATLSPAVARALKKCFSDRGWHTLAAEGQRITDEPDLVAGWGFREVMHDAWNRWPEKILHVDAGFWSRASYMKIEFGGRWLPVEIASYGASRFQQHHVNVRENRRPGKRILVCGMSAKAALSCGLQPAGWETDAIEKLRLAGATVVYRPKPNWYDARPIPKSTFDRAHDIERSFQDVHGVVSHHSNAAIDALAAGLPIYVHTGIAKALSVPSLRDIIWAEAPDRETRRRFLQQVAWHQWTLEEIGNGDWLEPPAPLAGRPLLEV